MPEKRIVRPLVASKAKILTGHANQPHEGLKTKPCKVCGKEKFAFFDFVNGRLTCKVCENAKKKKGKVPSEPKFKWKSYGKKKE